MIKDAAVSLIPGSIGLVIIKNAAVEFANSPGYWKQGPAALANEKKDNFDNILYSPHSSGAEFSLTARNIKYDLKILTPAAMLIKSLISAASIGAEV